ncbi:acetyltransferase [Agromyces sp. Root1464]|uniref:acyltransferase n=1 Tax=Agromyces sp. Root1464 TaxID=1736467 RepID=UPI0006F2AE91|nr:acyltransferase [Agromyces sp. Root1464]KQZ08733.1 acetyltransferase [Agromyces sp. Root1464]
MTERTPGRIPPNPYHEQCWVIGDPSIGEGTWIGAFTLIDGSGGLTIGSGCDISSGVHIYTHSTARRCVSGRDFAEIEREPVHIGDRVFIGANAVVNMGVSIGDEAVVGAGAVVTKDVPARTVVAGVPAHIVATVSLGTSEDPRPSFVPLQD